MAGQVQPKRWTIGEIVLATATVLLLAILQFRLLGFCLLLLFGVIFAFWRRSRSKRVIYFGGMLIIASLFLPCDIAIGSYHFGSRHGKSRGGPNFVTFTVGMPMHTLLIRRYGEYISGRCVWPAIFPPNWVLVWN